MSFWSQRRWRLALQVLRDLQVQRETTARSVLRVLWVRWGLRVRLARLVLLVTSGRLASEWWDPRVRKAPKVSKDVRGMLAMLVHPEFKAPLDLSDRQDHRATKD